MSTLLGDEKDAVFLKRDGNIFILYLNSGPNTLNTSFIRKIGEALDVVEESKGIACLVTTSTSDKFFSTGLDLDFFNKGLKTVEERQNFLRELMRLLGRILVFPIPTIAAINGHTIAAGMFIAMAHDFRVMREDQGFMCLSEINIGMSILDGQNSVLSCKLTPRVLSEALLTGKRYTSKEALKLGMVDRIASNENLLKEALSIANDMLPKSEVREAYGGIKKTMYRREYDLCMNKGLDEEQLKFLKSKSKARPKL
jgi:enoyl-CoA hydratase/carnithine racemase